MLIQNNNAYKVMYGMEFIGAKEVKDVDDATAKLLLNHPNICKYVSQDQVDDLEKDNKKLKAQLELAEAKAKAAELGIEFKPNIGLAKLQEKIAAKLAEDAGDKEPAEKE